MIAHDGYMKKLSAKTDYLLGFVILFAIGIASFAVAYRQTGLAITDISIHMMSADAIFRGNETTSYPGWFYVCGFLSHVLRLPLGVSAALASSIYNVLCFVVMYYILRQELGEANLTNHAIVFIMAFLGPIHFNTRDIYNNTALFNTWHNPTNTSVKFLALLCFFLMVYSVDLQKNARVDILGRPFTKRKIDIALSAAVFVSLLCKPSFFQVLAPTLGVIYFVQLCRGKKTIGDCFKDCLIYLPSLFLLFYQMFDNFGGPGEGFQIALFKVWRVFSSNLFLSTLSLMAFPVFVAAFCVKDWKKATAFQYAFAFFGVGLLEFAVLAETGERWADGNFSWGTGLGFGILCFYAIISFLKFIRANRDDQSVAVKIKSLAGGGLLLAHFCWGVWYYFQLLLGICWY